MIWLYVALAGAFGFAIGYFTRGYDDAERWEHLEADLLAARRAARQRDMDLRTPTPNRPITKGTAS